MSGAWWLGGRKERGESWPRVGYNLTNVEHMSTRLEAHGLTTDDNGVITHDAHAALLHSCVAHGLSEVAGAGIKLLRRGERTEISEEQFMAMRSVVKELLLSGVEKIQTDAAAMLLALNSAEDALNNPYVGEVGGADGHGQSACSKRDSWASSLSEHASLSGERDKFPEVRSGDGISGYDNSSRCRGCRSSSFSSISR